MHIRVRWKERIMERAGSLRKRLNVWQMPALSRSESTSSATKIGFEKRKLSVRSENTTLTGPTRAATTSTPQSSSSLSRQATGLTKKLPGKENLPSLFSDYAGKIRVTISKTTSKRKKSSNPTKFTVNSEKNIIRRRLSGDYDYQLSSTKSCLGEPNEPFNFPPKVVGSPETDVNKRDDITPRFSVYDDEKNGNTSPFGPRKAEGRRVPAETIIDTNSRREMDNIERVERARIYGMIPNVDEQRSRGAFPEAKVVALENCRATTRDDHSRSHETLLNAGNEEAADKTNHAKSEISPETRETANGTKFFGSQSSPAERISGVEFRIERVDCDGGRTPAMNNPRKVKSGSDIGRLKVPLRRGDDISPLKRRINKIRKSAMILGRKDGIAAVATATPVTEAVTAGSEMGLKSLKEVSKFAGSTASCFNRTRKREYRSSQESVINPSTGAVKKTKSLHPEPGVGETAEDISTSGGATLPEVEYEISHRSPLNCKKSAFRSAKDSIDSLFGDRRETSIPDVFKYSFAAEREKSESLTKYSSSNSIKQQREPQQRDSPPERSVIDDTERVLKAGKLIRKFCQPTLRDESSILKDVFIEFVYDDPVDKHRDELQRTINVFENSQLQSLFPNSSIPAPEVAAIRPIEQELADDDPSFTGCSWSEGDPVKNGRTAFNSNAARISDLKIDTVYFESCNGENGSCQEWHAGVARFEKKSAPILSDDVPENITIRSIAEGIQYSTDYTDETIDLEQARERCCYKISQTFLKGKVITPVQRRIVVNFLISVHVYLSTSSSTLYQAIKIFDSILDIKDVSVEELQLVALGAFWIALKNMETKIPTASEMISFAKDMYRTGGSKLLCKCERKILKTLGFNIRFPDPFYISAYYLEQWSTFGAVANEASIRKTIYRCAGYLMDVSLLDENYSGITAELLAAAAMRTAARLVLSTSWEPPVDHSLRIGKKITGYTQKEIECVAGPWLEGVLRSAEKNSSTGAAYKKYKNSRYDNTSDYLVSRIIKLLPPISSSK